MANSNYLIINYQNPYYFVWWGGLKSLCLKARKDQVQGILLYQNLKGIFPIPQLFNWLTN